MKTIYNAVMHQLQTDVPSLNWIELNVGQLKQIKEGNTLPLTYPCALVGITMPECSDITDKIQDCNGIVTITLVFEPITIGSTSSNVSEGDRNDALVSYEIISDVYKALQGFETNNFNSLSRISQGEVEHDKLFVYKIDFKCDFEDLTAIY